jgi:hypothetical protein
MDHHGDKPGMYEVIQQVQLRMLMMLIMKDVG